MKNQLESLFFRFVTIIGQNDKSDPPRSDYIEIKYSTKNITFDKSKKIPCTLFLIV